MEKDMKLLPDKIYAWNYVGCFNTGLSIPVVDMGDTPWDVYVPKKQLDIAIEALEKISVYDIDGDYNYSDREIMYTIAVSALKEINAVQKGNVK